MSAVIRLAEPADAASLVALAEAVGAEPERWLIAGGKAPSVADERRYLRSLRGYAGAAVLVADVDGRVVARLSIARDTHPACAHVADLGLMVAREERRRGVGTQLLEAAVDWARARGVRKLELHVFPHNEGALALYRRFGFEEEGYRRGHYRRGADYVDAILMAYAVESGPGSLG